MPRMVTRLIFECLDSGHLYGFVKRYRATGRIFGAVEDGSLEWVGGGEAQLEAADVAGGVAAGGGDGVSAAGGDAQV